MERAKDRTNEQRIERLERELRRTRRWLAALGAALLVGCVSALAAPRDDVVRARCFVLEDAGGIERGTFGLAAPDGRRPEPVLWMVSADERSTLELGLTATPVEDETVGYLDVEASRGENESGATLLVGGRSEGRSGSFLGLHDGDHSALFGVYENRPQLLLARSGGGDEDENEAGLPALDQLAPAVLLRLDDGRAELRARDADGNVVPVR